VNTDSARPARGRLLRAAALGLLVVPFATPLRAPGWLQSHEGLAYPIRLAQLVRCWEDGFWSGRWFPDLNAGQGYPFLCFYAPLSYWIAGVFHAAGASLALALKLPALLGALALTTGTYRLARLASAPAGAFAAAAFALYAPYVVRNVYIRGDLAEHAALGFLPWSLFAVLRLGGSRRARDVAFVAVTGALPILTHNITGLVTGAMMLLSALIAALCSSRRMRTLLAAALGGSAALLLSAFFWVPALGERAFVRIESMTEGVYAVERNFVAFRALLGPPAIPGVGQDLPMSFEVGYVVLVALLLLPAARGPFAPPARPVLAVATLAAVSGLVMGTRLGAPVYDFVPLLRFVQFPWRFFGLMSLGLAVLGGLAIDRFLERRALRVRAAAVILAAAASVAVVWPIMVAKRIAPIPSWAVDPEVLASKRGTVTGLDEYMPVWVEEPGSGRGFVDGVRVEGDGKLVASRRAVGRYDFSIAAVDSVVVILRDVYYPGWRAWTGGVAIPLAPRAGSGNMQLALGPGRHDVRVRLGPTALRRAAESVSAATLVLGIAALGWSGRRGWRAARAASG
jgi:hypothetical protein